MTVANLMAVFIDIEIEVVKQCLVIPQNYTTETLQQQTEDVVKQEMFAWWLMSSPFASWDMIAAEDCYAGPAVRLVKSRLPDITSKGTIPVYSCRRMYFGRIIYRTSCKILWQGCVLALFPGLPLCVCLRSFPGACHY